ncbi:hypothetical protein CBR_g52368 [Chara braunii]|uniref:CCHC-type domain-containing protein n=1 Tax=Chara braunii TaxID=69332 RepID=A0A388K6W6_CHABU|nr:hypothetical protein CBR_g52368 [Chara braunii]|eukprot:GBG65777.1 hypothetical protein CBR_g52368 [Chara braunii]
MEIAGLRKEIGLLREQNERIIVESNLWKEEAARPGNKRGSVVIGTPDGTNRGTPKPRCTGSVRDGETGDRWKEEYRNLRSLHRLANIEAEALKEKRAEAERKRMEAEKQVKALEEQMSKLTAECGNAKTVGGTNLKERMEEVAVRSVRKGVKATPGRAGGKSTVTEINDHGAYRGTMSSQGHYDRNERDRERNEWDRGRRDRDSTDEHGERRPYRPPTCFACHEVGHYANQCPNRSKRYSNVRPSTSLESRRARSPRRYEPRSREPSPTLDPQIRSTIEKLGKSVAIMEEHYATEREKREQKARKKLEKEEAQRREAEEATLLEEEHITAEKKARRRKQKLMLEDQRRAEMQKDLQIQLAMHVGDLEDRLIQRLNQAVGGPSKQYRGKKKVSYRSDVDESTSSQGDASDISVTQELGACVDRLKISEKRKRGPEPVFEDPSPPMELPAKRTPKRGILKPVKLTG